MSRQSKVSGVVLAGGQGKRMGQQDKGLILYRQQPLVKYALDAMAGITADIVISANRNHVAYASFGYAVVADDGDAFDGPLAGILAAMKVSEADILLVLPCDSPLIQTSHLQRLISGLGGDADIAVVFDGERLHPVVLALKTGLRADLADYLAAGERKLSKWLYRHTVREVDFSDQAGTFANINTMAELASLQIDQRV